MHGGARQCNKTPIAGRTLPRVTTERDAARGGGSFGDPSLSLSDNVDPCGLRLKLRCVAERCSCGLVEDSGLTYSYSGVTASDPGPLDAADGVLVGLCDDSVPAPLVSGTGRTRSRSGKLSLEPTVCGESFRFGFVRNGFFIMEPRDVLLPFSLPFCRNEPDCDFRFHFEDSGSFAAAPSLDVS